MSTLIAFLLYVVVSLLPQYPSDRLYLCNGLEVNNTDSAFTSEYGDMWIIHFSQDDKLTNVVIFDSCWNYRAYEISPNGIEGVEF